MRIDTVKEMTKERFNGTIYEIYTTRWSKNAITFDASGKIKK